MAYAAKLCNPTPWLVKLPWDKGVVINVPEFGEATLNMQQMDDFKPGKPGSENVLNLLGYHGLFLFDVDRPYDNQALEAITTCWKAKKFQYDEAVARLKRARSSQGIQDDPELLEEVLDQMGLSQVRDKVEVLKEQIDKYTKIVGADHVVGVQMDPKRTVYAMEPPREFPSIAAMEFFLEQNPEIAAKHEAFKRQQQGAPVESATPGLE
jgi:hypothetical protein